jgi:hypothetical protein
MDRNTAIAKKLIVDFITTQRQPKTYIKASPFRPIPVGAFSLKDPAKSLDKLLFSDSESIMFCNFKQLSNLAKDYKLNLVQDGKFFVFEQTEETVLLKVI